VSRRVRAEDETLPIGHRSLHRFPQNLIEARETVLDLVETASAPRHHARLQGRPLELESGGTLENAISQIVRDLHHLEQSYPSLEGKATSRKVNLDVTVDGTEGAALGVMSQGELHSLALALFLPRATLDASPFRFLVIDDPVQSMDPARVDGLARVLGDVASNRQIVVFTHDDRLPDAVRRLDVPARIIEVLRREASVVELREVRSPMRQYLEDAFALVSTKDLPEVARERVVPGLCRHSLEAACIDVVRRRRLSRGDSHEAIEELFNTQSKLVPRLALALFDDAEKAGDVYASIKNRFGPWQVDTVKFCNEGAHKGFPQDDALSFVRNAEKLANELAKLK
jgi:AAA domain, putative AbiEii toxin, Type IV TA system